jgi:hypothetical protein
MRTALRPLDLAPLDDAGLRKTLRTQARAMPDAAAFICDTLQLARICPRTACRKADRCRNDPRTCRDTTGEAVPVEAYEFAVLLAQAWRDDEPACDVEALYPVEAAGWRCWVAALGCAVTRR